MILFLIKVIIVMMKGEVKKNRTKSIKKSIKNMIENESMERNPNMTVLSKMKEDRKKGEKMTDMNIKVTKKGITMTTVMMMIMTDGREEERKIEVTIRER